MHILANDTALRIVHLTLDALDTVEQQTIPELLPDVLNRMVHAASRVFRWDRRCPSSWTTTCPERNLSLSAALSFWAYASPCVLMTRYPPGLRIRDSSSSQRNCDTSGR